MNAFSNPELNTYLKSHHITTVFIGGLFGEACIYRTAKGAIEYNYTTIVLTDCIALKTQSNKSRMIEKYIKQGAKAVTSHHIA